MNTKRSTAKLCGVLVALAGLNLWGYCALSAAEQRAQVATQNADLCRQLASHILSLKSRPTLVGAKEQAQQELSQAVESIVRSTGLAGDNLALIEPDPAVRLADTAYLERPTTVQLRGITLLQLAEVVSKLSDDRTGLKIKTLRLTTPPDQLNGQLWSAEFTVSYLVYSPLPLRQGSSERS